MMTIKIRRTSLALTVLLFTLSCSHGSGGDSSGSLKEAQSGASVTSASAVTNANGEAAVQIPIPAGVNKMSVTAATDAFIATDVVSSDAGITYLSFDGEFIEDSLEFGTFVSAVNIPSRDFDPPLTGTTLTVQNTVASSDADNAAPLPGRTVNYGVLTRSDPDLNSGTLQINVAFIGATANDPGLKAALEQATDVFKSIYSSQAGITLNVNEFSFDGPGILPDPEVGDGIYGAISTAVPSPAVNICVGLDLTTPDLLGEAAGIPGSPLPSVKSCVGVSGINAAGPDGAFSPEDVRVLGETMAHEVGHYMGLFHPVEEDFATFDPLIDTPQCAGEAQCDALLGANNMYYTPLDDGHGGLIPQGLFTPQQRGVLNRYAAVD